MTTIRLKALTLAAAAVSCLAGGASAATVTIDFGNQSGNYTPYTEDLYSFGTSAQLDNSGGNCPFGDPACLHLSSSGNGADSTTTLTAIDGSAFDLFDLSFRFSGNSTQGPTTLTGSDGTVYTLQKGSGTGEFTFGTNYTANAGLGLNGAALFSGVTSVIFSQAAGGSIRIDDVVLTDLTPVPVPASGLLLVGAIGALAMSRRKKKASS